MQQPDDIDRQPTTAELEAREAGPLQPPVPEVGELPAGGSLWPGGPHHETKVSLVNTQIRCYRFTTDEAIRHSRTNAERMLNDLVILDALEARVAPLRHLSWRLEAQDETDPAQMRAVKKLTAVIEQTPKWVDVIDGLAWGLWYGWSGVRFRYKWSYDNATREKRMVVADHLMVNGDTLVPRWSGDWGILVNGTADIEKDPSDRWGSVHWFTPREAEALVVHGHRPFDTPFQEWQMAAQIRGRSLRGDVYWAWFIKSQFEALLAEYAERFTNGVWIGWFPTTNPDGKAELEAALAGYKSDRVLLLPRREDNQATAYGVDIKEVGTATPQFILNLIDEYNERIRRYISGLSLADGTEINVGGDGVGAMEDRVGAVIKNDAVRLAETLTSSFVSVLCKYNCGPNVPTPVFKFDVDSPNCDDLLSRAKILHDMGVAIDTDHLRVVCGLPKPSPGDEVATAIAPMSPVAATQTPQSVPQVGPAGPQTQQQSPPQFVSPSPQPQQLSQPDAQQQLAS